MSDPYKVDRWICATCGHDSSMEPHWKVRAEHAEARVKELEAQVEREVALGMEYATKVEELRKLCGEAADILKAWGLKDAWPCAEAEPTTAYERLRAAEKAALDAKEGTSTP